MWGQTHAHSGPERTRALRGDAWQHWVLLPESRLQTNPLWSAMERDGEGKYKYVSGGLGWAAWPSYIDRHDASEPATSFTFATSKQGE